MATVRIEGIDEVRRILGAAIANATLRRPMQRSLLRLHGVAGDYGRSLGPPSPRYMRGRGPVNASGVVTRLTSQNLGKRWTEEIYEDSDGLRGVLGNVVSYGPYVHAAEGEPRQAWMHRNRGALTDARILANEESWIRDEFDSTIQSVFDGAGVI